MSNAGFVTGRFIEPEKVISHFHLHEGDVVADFGAGKGFFANIIAGAVGPSGKVYALEIQKELVQAIGDEARKKGHSNVLPHWCDIEELNGTPIKDGELDAAIVVNTFFQIENKPEFMKEVFRTLRSGAKFILVDWIDSFGGIGPHPTQVVMEGDARAHAEAAGFVFERSFDTGEHHYGLAFRK